MLLDRRVDVGKGADRAGNCTGRNIVPRGLQSGAVAVELGIGLGELQAEGHRLGVDAMAAADGRGQFMLVGAALQHLEQRIQVLDQQVCRLLQLHRQARVEHVAAGHALVKPAPLRPKLFAGPGQEGDDVMLRHRLDRIDRGHVDLAQHVGIVGLADRRRILGRDHPDLAHRLGREHLDRPPDAIAVLRRPDGGHRGTGIAGDHAAPLVKSGSPRA